MLAYRAHGCNKEAIRSRGASIKSTSITCNMFSHRQTRLNLDELGLWNCPHNSSERREVADPQSQTQAKKKWNCIFDLLPQICNLITGSGGQLSVDDPISYTDTHSKRDPDTGVKVFAQSGEALAQCVVVIFCGVFISEASLPGNYEEDEDGDEDEGKKTKQNPGCLLCWLGFKTLLASRGPVPGCGRKRPHSTFRVKTSSMFFVCLFVWSIKTSQVRVWDRITEWFFFSLLVCSFPAEDPAKRELPSPRLLHALTNDHDFVFTN